MQEEELQTWGQVSAYLHEVEVSETWRATARTFTEWAKAFAGRRGCTVTLLWRYKSAGRFYKERRAALRARGIHLPKLELISDSVSAEAVELLAKVFRVAPEDVVAPIELPTLKGEIQKKQVRAIWDSYSPLLEGQTARGKGVEAPRRVLDRASRAEADVLLGLKRSEGRWMASEPSMFECYPEADVASESRRSPYRCDAYVVSRHAEDREVRIHGIDIRPLDNVRPMSDAALTWARQAVDYYWVATPSLPESSSHRGIPKLFGILHVSVTGEVVVIREAEKLIREYTPGEKVARDLLARSRK